MCLRAQSGYFGSAGGCKPEIGVNLTNYVIWHGLNHDIKLLKDVIKYTTTLLQVVDKSRAVVNKLYARGWAEHEKRWVREGNWR